jgi:hypothetical protein
MDIVVFHPNTTYYNGRPNWLARTDKRPVQINLNNVGLEFPLMILAFNDDEDYKNAVPVDILEIEEGENAHLYLEKDKYNILVVNESGSAVKFKKTVN